MKDDHSLRRITGDGGEDEACRYLENNGYKIICRNYYAGHNEIDIIAECDMYIVFVEVKTRTEFPGTSAYGRPASSVNAKKRKCLARAAECYIKSHKTTKFFRFDAVEVLLCHDSLTGNGFYKVNHMKGVFGAAGKIWI